MVLRKLPYVSFRCISLVPNNNIHPWHLVPPLYPAPPHPLPPRHVLHTPLHFPISTILNHKIHNLLDNDQIYKKFTSYLCQWHLPNGHIFNKWLPQYIIIPWHS
jgi:hypothetical protein